MKLFLIALSFFSFSYTPSEYPIEIESSEMELICVDVVICLKNGECFILEVCAESEDLEDYSKKVYLGGALGDENSTLRVSGLSSFSSGSYLLIKPNSKLKPAKGSQTAGVYPSRSVIAGKYKVLNGKTTLKLGRR